MTERLHVTIRRDTPSSYMLSVSRAAPPFALAAQRATHAECQALAERVVEAVQRGGTGPDVLDLVHAAERAAQAILTVETGNE